nr:hypothetical protein Hi04_10k_c361_00005 [uncultured bacterium]
MRLLLAARLSQKNRNGQQGIGIDTQDERGREWAEREGHQVIGVAADTRKGTVAPWDRPNLKPWVTEPDRMAQYDGILAYRNDRLSRGIWADEVRIRLWAEEHGKTLLIVDGPQWPPRHPGDKWSWEAMADSARREWESIQERNIRMQAHLRENGYLVGDCPFGYRIVKADGHKLLEPDPVTGPIVVQMVERYLDGQSLPELCRWLDSIGAQTRHGGQWWPTSVRTILGNEAMIGRRQQGKTVLKFDPLVDRATWARLQARLAENPRKTFRTELSLLAGIIHCGLCGRRMARKAVYTKLKDGSKNYLLYYQCNGSARDRSTCRNMLRMDAADEYASSWVTEVIGRARLYERTTKPGHGHDDEIADVKQAIRDLDVEAADYDAELARLRAELAGLKQLPVTQPQAEERDTGLTVGQYWDGLSDVEAKRRFLMAGKVKVLAVSELKKRKGTEPRDLQFSVTCLVGGDWTWR